MSNSNLIHGAAPIGTGGTVAAWTVDTTRRYSPVLRIIDSGGAEDGVFMPAASISIGGESSLKALRGIICEALDGFYSQLPEADKKTPRHHAEIAAMYMADSSLGCEMLHDGEWVASQSFSPVWHRDRCYRLLNQAGSLVKLSEAFIPSSR